MSKTVLHHRAKLDDHDVWLVCELHAAGLALAEIARKFDVSTACIWKTVHGYTHGRATSRVVRDTAALG